MFLPRKKSVQRVSLIIHWLLYDDLIGSVFSSEELKWLEEQTAVKAHAAKIIFVLKLDYCYKWTQRLRWRL